MSVFDTLFANWSAPTLMANNATPGALTIRVFRGSRDDVGTILIKDADAIIGDQQLVSEMKETGGFVDVAQREVTLLTDEAGVHKGIARLTVNQAIAEIRMPGTTDVETWTVDEVLSRTETMIRCRLRELHVKEAGHRGKYLS